MGFVGVYRALYDYAPQTSQELAIEEGDLLYIIEKSSDDDWWKAKKRAGDDDDEEPEGLIPNNYIEEAPHASRAKALYDYDRQTDEELSFVEDTILQVYDTSDPDWTLVGGNGEYGFVPANYIEIVDTAPPPMPSRPQPVEAQSFTEGAVTPSPPASPVQSPAAALAGIIQQKTGPSSPATTRTIAPRQGGGAEFTPEASDEEAPPSLPQRPPSQHVSSPPLPDHVRSGSPEPPGVQASPPHNRISHRDSLGEGAIPSPIGYHLYNIHEMISHMGKNKKMPTTLGINVVKGVIMIAPEKSRDGPQKEWSADKLTHYSIEGKHVFIELVRPSRSIDFHAGTKDTAQEIVASLGELAGAARAEGLREVLEVVGSGQKKGHMLYEFMAQGDDEVTVAVGDDVIILDDTQSEEWWMVRRVKNGKEGVVPSSYVEVMENSAPEKDPAPRSGMSTVEQNRLEEDRMTREAARSSSKGNNNPVERSRRDNRSGSKASSSSKSKPNTAKVRTWTDRTGTFKVEAEFLGLKDGKIHLHKLNGVKIAVPVAKMSVNDIEYVEQVTGQSLDEEKPLSDIKRKTNQKSKSRQTDQLAPGASGSAGAAVEASSLSKYDWFDFFLQCGVNPQICERYAAAFERDQMGEENMQDIEPTLLRTLGIKEGDILRIMKLLDSKYGRVRGAGAAENGDATGADGVNGDSGGIFSGPSGALRNNTRKGRPAPTVSTNDTVDPRAFEQDSLKRDLPTDAAPTPLRSVPTPKQKARSGFDDDAWDVKPSKQDSSPARVASPPAQQSNTPEPAKPLATGAMAELSLLSPPLQPTPAAQSTDTQEPLSETPGTKGASPSFFDQLAQPPAQNIARPQSNPQQASFARQRPQAAQQPVNQSSLIPPPPQRPGSAPQNMNQPSAFGPPGLRDPLRSGYQMQVTPGGQSMNDLNQQRYQQSYGQQIGQQQGGFGYGSMVGPIGPQQTGFQQFPQNAHYGGYQQPLGYQQTSQFLNSQQTGSPFADPPRQQFQPTPSQLQVQQTGVNAFLPPSLQPQQTGINGFGQGGSFNNHQTNSINPHGNQQLQSPFQSSGPVPPAPAPAQQQLQPQPTAAPLQPQRTGPAPPIRFGVSAEAQKLMPQPTGRRANLAQATPQNPFGF